MAQTGEAAGSERSRDDTTTRIAEDVSGLVRAWTEAYAEMSIGTSRILTNLAVDLVGTGYVKPLNRAIRDTADVMRRSSDILEKAYQAE